MRSLLSQNVSSEMVDKVLKPFLPSVPILYPVKTLENLGFLMFSGRYKVGTLARNGSGRLCQLFYTWLFDPFVSSHCITKNFIFSHLYASVNCFINDYLTPSSRASISTLRLETFSISLSMKRLNEFYLGLTDSVTNYSQSSL